MVYLWRIPDDYPQSLIGEYQRDGAPDRFIFKRGEPILEVIDLPVIRFNAPLAKLREFDCLSSNAMVPLVNATVVDILQDMAPSDVQFVKARVIGSDSATDEFVLLNIACKINGIDRERSEFKYVPGTQQIMSFRKLDYLEGCLGVHGIARDGEYLSHLLVSDLVAGCLIGKGLTGIELVRPTEVAW